MTYRIASRDNIENDIMEVWPAVLDNKFTRFNNRIENCEFGSEGEILSWLDNSIKISKMGKLSNNNQIQTQNQIINNNGNKIYSVYKCDNVNSNYDEYLYSLKLIKRNDIVSTKGISSFKKLNVQQKVEEKPSEYSSDMRNISGINYEGIFPLDVDKMDKVIEEYIKYVSMIHDTDYETDRDAEYDVVFMDRRYHHGWRDNLLKKLETVEDFLIYFSRRNVRKKLILNDGYIDERRHKLQNHIDTILMENRRGTFDDNQLQNKIRTIIMDPELCNEEKGIFQIRIDGEIVTWHKNYRNIIKNLYLVPSRKFIDIIMKFNLAHLYKQYQDIDNIQKIHDNIRDIYGLKKDRNTIILLGNQNTVKKYNIVRKSFAQKAQNNNINDNDNISENSFN